MMKGVEMKFIIVFLISILLLGNAYADNRYTKVFSMLGTEFDELEETYDGLGYFSIAIDNDGLTGTDNYYTHGHLLSWGTNTAEMYCKRKVLWGNSFVHVSDWINDCDIDDQYLRSQSFFYGTQLHTPENIKILPEDLGEQYKPYAGWTFIGREVEFHSTTGKFKKYSLSVGCIGPCSAADRQQRFAHDTSSKDNDPVGWDQQITNDIAVQYKSSGSWGEPYLNPNESKFGLGVIPYWFNSIGTVKINAGVGIKVSMNLNLGNSSIQKSGELLSRRVRRMSGREINPNYGNVSSEIAFPSDEKFVDSTVCDDYEDDKYRKGKFSLIVEETLDENETNKERRKLTLACHQEYAEKYLEAIRRKVNLSIFFDASVAFNYFDALLEGGLFGGTQHHIVEPTIFPRKMEFGAVFTFPMWSRNSSAQIHLSKVVQDHDVWAQAKEGKTMSWGSLGIKYSNSF